MAARAPPASRTLSSTGGGMTAAQPFSPRRPCPRSVRCATPRTGLQPGFARSARRPWRTRPRRLRHRRRPCHRRQPCPQRRPRLWRWLRIARSAARPMRPAPGSAAAAATPWAMRGHRRLLVRRRHLHPDPHRHPRRRRPRSRRRFRRHHPPHAPRRHLCSPTRPRRRTKASPSAATSASWSASCSRSCCAAVRWAGGGCSAARPPPAK